MLRRRLLLVLVATAAGVLLPAAGADAALETLVQDDASLMNRPPDQVRAAMLKLRSLGVDRIRLTASWSLLAPDPAATSKPAGFDARDPGAYPQEPWQGLDDAVQIAHETGLKVMIDIGFWAPHWATHDPPGPRARTNVDPQAFADFAVAVATRYSGSWAPPPIVTPAPPPPEDPSPLDGLFGGPQGATAAPTVTPQAPLPSVDQFVLWNEPNHPGLLLPQWTGSGRNARPASPVLYARMVRAAYPAAKAVRPDAKFLLGNTSSDGGDPPKGAVAPLLFIRRLACVDDRLRPLHTKDCRHYKRLPGDGWAHHPYPRQLRPDSHASADRPDNVRIGDLDRLSLLLRRLANRGRISRALRQIHITEFGYETTAIPGRPTISQATQARWLTWAEYLASRVPGVVTFAQFLLRDLPPGTVRVSDSKVRSFGQYYSGLENVDGSDKIAARTFTAGLFAQRRRSGAVLLWARLRLGAGPRAITIQRKRGGGPWRTIRHRSADGQSAFSVLTGYVPRALYRLRWPLADGSIVDGLPVKVVRASRPPR